MPASRYIIAHPHYGFLALYSPTKVAWTNDPEDAVPFADKGEATTVVEAIGRDVAQIVPA